MTDTMIERVAAGLRKEAAMIGIGTDGVQVDVATYADLLARAAIEAMRTPSEGVTRAIGDEVLEITDWGISNEGARGVWSAAIDAALSHDEVKG